MLYARGGKAEYGNMIICPGGIKPRMAAEYGNKII